MTEPTEIGRPPERRVGPDPHASRRGLLVAAYGRTLFSIVPQLFLTPSLPADNVRRLAAGRLRRILVHAMRHVPFYRRRFTEAGLTEEELSRLEDLSRVPILEKVDLRESGGELFAEGVDPSRLLVRRSSGSSGVPTTVYFDPLRDLPRRVQELRFLFAHGFRPWHEQYILDAPAYSPPKRFLPQKLGLWRRQLFPWQLAPEEMVRQLNRSKPEIFHGVLSDLRMLAEALDLHGGLTYRPKLIIAKGELVDGRTRAILEEKLKAPVVDLYATEEVGIIAWQCPTSGGHHIDADFVHVETVGEDGRPTADGQLGEIVVTNLYQRSFPIIRFRTGDLGTLSQKACGCGRGLPLLTSLQGRKLDAILTPEWTMVQPFLFLAVMEHIPAVRRYQISQLDLEHLQVSVNWEPGATAEERQAANQAIQENFRRLVGEKMQVEVAEAQEFRRADFRSTFAKKFHLVRGLPPEAIEELRKQHRFALKF